MKRPLILLLLLVFSVFAADAQKKHLKPRPKTAAPKTAADNRAFVIDERLAVLRAAPDLAARPLRRLRRGRALVVFEARTADGVTFYRVGGSSNAAGWIQREAVALRARRGDDGRLVELVLASQGFDRLERARLFLDNFPASPFRPSILLLFGDLLEEAAQNLSNAARRRLSDREMAASGAPLHSFFLNYAGLDRYRRLGIGFAFNGRTRRFHYDGASWREIVEKTPASAEAAEARKRLDALAVKLAAVP